MGTPPIPADAEIKTLLIWSTPEAEAAYLALVNLRAKAAPGIETKEIEAVMFRLLSEHARPGAIITVRNAGLVERLRYTAGNPSAWPEGFDQNISDLLAEAAMALSASGGE